MKSPLRFSATEEITIPKLKENNQSATSFNKLIIEEAKKFNEHGHHLPGVVGTGAGVVGTGETNKNHVEGHYNETVCTCYETNN